MWCCYIGQISYNPYHLNVQLLSWFDDGAGKISLQRWQWMKIVEQLSKLKQWTMAHGWDSVVVCVVDGDHRVHWLNRLDVLVVVLPNGLDPLSMIPVKIHWRKHIKINTRIFMQNGFLPPNAQLNVSFVWFSIWLFRPIRNVDETSCMEHTRSIHNS